MLRSLRAKFGVTATAGLLVALVMFCLLIVLANRNERIVKTAQETQHSIAGLFQMQTALDSYQAETLAEVREGPMNPPRYPTVRADFIFTATAIRTPPPSAGPLQKEAAERLYQQSMRVVERYDRRLELNRQIDEIWATYPAQQAQIRVRAAQAEYYDEYYKLRELMHVQALLENQVLQTQVDSAFALRSTTTPIALLSLIFALIGYGVVLSLVWGRLGPGLRKLEASAKAVGAGELDRATGVEGNDELASVSRAFDSMASQLVQKQQSLQEFAARQEVAIADRTRELEAANQALASADQRRRAFLADISHELRTPLTLIRGEAQVALRAHDDIDPIETLNRILSQTRALSRLVDDLFLISVAEAGGLVLQEQAMDVTAVARRVAKDVASITQEFGIVVTLRAEGPVMAHADPDRVRQVLMGLIDNALRHARRPSGEPIEITLSVHGDATQVVVTVADNGQGFAQDTMSELFIRFRRGMASEGSGLGLSVARALVEAMNGSVELANRPEGGAKITLRLQVSAYERDHRQKQLSRNDAALFSSKSLAVLPRTG